VTPSPPGQQRASAARVVDVDPLIEPRWDAFVASCPDATIFHHSSWLRTLQAEYGQRPQGLACRSDTGEILGVLPLLLTRGMPFRKNGHLSGRRLSSLPRTPVAGPLAIDRSVAKALIDAAVDRVRDLPDVRLQLKLAGPDLDGLAEGVTGSRWRPTYTVELPPPPAAMRFGNSRNQARIKWAVRKSERLGVRVRAAATERELRAWYVLYLETMRCYAIPPRPYRLFAAMWALLRPQGLMELLLAEHEEAHERKLLAGSIFLKLGGTVFYAFNGRHREDLSLRPNDNIMWTAIHDAARAGYRRLDLGEVDPSNVTLAEFKKKWGSSESWLYRYHYPDPGGPVDSSPDRRAFGAVRSVWQRLPLAGTALLGDQIYRYL
jgi:CelD/BcsL family acetyltransferase involved in cellulose biosynthesis